MEEKEEEWRVAEGTKAETFTESSARLIFTLYRFYFKADNKTHLPADMHAVDSKNRSDEVCFTLDMTFVFEWFSASAYILHSLHLEALTLLPTSTPDPL